MSRAVSRVQNLILGWDTMIRVAVADDHPHAQAGIRRLLARMPEVGSVVVAPSAEALARTGAEVDVLLLALYRVDREPALAEIEEWTPAPACSSSPTPSA